MYARNNVLEAVRFDDLLCLLRNVAGVNGKNALRACTRREKGQDAGTAPNVEHSRAAENLRVRHDERRVRRCADLVLDHNGMNI